MQIDNLPPEILTQVIHYNNPNPIVLDNLRRVSPAFKLAASDNSLWRQHTPATTYPKLAPGQLAQEFQQRRMSLDPQMEQALQAMWQSSLSFEQVRHIIQQNPDHWDLVYAAIQQHPEAIRWASPRLQNNAVAARAALLEDGETLEYFGPNIQADPSLVMLAVQQNGLALRWAAPPLQDDKDIVLAAVRKNGEALSHASNAMRRDKDIARTVLAESVDMFFQWSDLTLLHDPDIALEVVRASGLKLRFLPPEYRRHEDIVQAACNQNGFALLFAHPTLQSRKDIVLQAVKTTPAFLSNTGTDFRKDPDIVLAAVRQNGYLLQAADPQLQSNFCIALTAVRQDGMALQWVDASLRQDKHIIFAALQQNPQAQRFVPKHPLAPIRLASQAAAKVCGQRLYLGLIQRSGPSCRSMLPKTLLENKNFMLKAVAIDGNMLQWAPAALRSDRDVVMAAVAQNQQAFGWASPTLRNDEEIQLCINKSGNI